MAKQLTLKELLESEKIEERLETVKFEEGMRLLETLVEKVESGSLELEQAVLSYERGALLVEHIKSLLGGAEEKLRTLKESARKD